MIENLASFLDRDLRFLVRNMDGFDEALIDGIYEAAIVPELWPSALDRVSDATGATGGALFAINSHRMRWTASHSVAPLLSDYVERWAANCCRAHRAATANHPGFVTDLDLFTREELDADPRYEFLRDRGFGWCAITAIPVPSGDFLIFSLERQMAQGPADQTTVEQLDLLRPHLARGGLISARLGLERAKAAMVLDVLGLPAAVLTHSHQMLVGNELLNSIVPAVLQDRRDRVHLTDRRADTLLEKALEGIWRTDSVYSVPIPATDEHPPMIVHLIPIRGAAQDVFAVASAVLAITPVERASVPSAEVIQGLFDLTPAEARVARAIAEGKRVEEIAAAHGTSASTVRMQLKSVFAKTGRSRQADLVSLLGSAGICRS